MGGGAGTVSRGARRARTARLGVRAGARLRLRLGVRAGVAALVLAALATGCTEGAPGPGPGPVPAPSTAPLPVPPRPTDVDGPVRIPSAPELPGWAHDVDLAADGSGFALLTACVTDEAAGASPGSGFCRQPVVALDRGATAWAPRRSPLPERPPNGGVSAGLVSLGPGRALIEDGGGDTPELTWFTENGGRTWRTVDRRAIGTAPTVPTDAALVVECVSPAGAAPDNCARERVVLISPADGRRRALAHQPALGPHPRPARGREPDGSWWVTGTDPASGRPAVAYSRDDGRSWTVRALPSRSRTARGLAVVVGPDAVYAAETGELDGGEPELNGLLALYRSTDGGRSWTLVRATGPTGEPRSLSGLPVPGPGGRLRLYGSRGGYESTDGGRTFRPTGEGTRWVRRTAAGLLREGGQCQWATTRDGVNWSEFQLACEDSP
ncbi:WD40/YVTN/BNR-like repeat-containing protein [Streptomyces sp. NPDC090025]|uniref:WD40/YVTN/BNR-like repeat-containing protein n=1 Tax=Streptomyces sp. NPDC090025 TaxID=3365922 RepID=UPI003838650B